MGHISLVKTMMLKTHEIVETKLSHLLKVYLLFLTYILEKNENNL